MLGHLASRAGRTYRHAGHARYPTTLRPKNLRVSKEPRFSRETGEPTPLSPEKRIFQTVVLNIRQSPAAVEGIIMDIGQRIGEYLARRIPEWEEQLERTLEKRVARHPSDSRNLPEYRELRSTLGLGVWRRESQLQEYTAYALERAGITEYAFLYEMLLAAHTKLNPVQLDWQAMNPIRRWLTGSLLGWARQIAVDRVGVYTTQEWDVYERYLQDPAFQKDCLETLYDKIAPVVVEEMTNGPSEEYQNWLAGQ